MEKDVLIKQKIDYKDALINVDEQIEEILKYADNYDELLETFESIDKDAYDDLIWCDGTDRRNFEMLLEEKDLYTEMIGIIDKILESTDNSKAIQQLKKKSEGLLRVYRGNKKNSKDIIALEEQHIKINDDAINLIRSLTE